MKASGYMFWLLFFLFGMSNQSFTQSADIILTNGKIFTSDTSHLYVQAIAIRGNKIMATGANAEIEKLASGKTRRIDLKGKTVVPGFNDQHDHAAFQYSPAPMKYETTDDQDLNWDGLPKAAVLDSIARILIKARAGDWITGVMGNKVFYDTSMRRSLDSIAPDHPVFLRAWWGHGLITNAKGLEAIGIDDHAKNPIGGWYGRNSSGQIASVHENAQIAFWQAISKKYQGNVLKQMEAYGQEQLKGGITSTLFFGSSFSYETVSQILKQASIPQRLRIVAWANSTAESRKLWEWPIAESHPTPLSTVSGIKYLVNHFGPLNYHLDTLRQILKEALATKRQLMMHISGDTAFAIVLKLMEEMGRAEQWRPLRVRIEHNMIGSPSAMQRKQLRDFGVLIMHTPKYNTPSPLQSLIKDGVIVGISPDGTVNPFSDIMTITTQQEKPEENISREQAVLIYTRTNAFAEFREKEKGLLTKGMLADLVVLSDDLFSVPADQLPAIRSVMTIIDGKVVYEKP